MHKTQIRPDVIERILKRRGQLHIHDQIDSVHTALIVIDMQNAFVQPRLPSAVPVAREIVPNINRLANALRDHGGRVVWVYTTFTENTLNDWSAFFGGVYSNEFSKAVVSNLCAGAEGHALWPELDVKDQDWQISKNRFSAFLPGACELAQRLNQANIDTVLITGTLTNVCCESSARDALMCNFNVVMVSDGNAALSDADHNASMTALAQTFADVMSTAEVIDRLHLYPGAARIKEY